MSSRKVTLREWTTSERKSILKQLDSFKYFCLFFRVPIEVQQMLPPPKLSIKAVGPDSRIERYYFYKEVTFFLSSINLVKPVTM